MAGLRSDGSCEVVPLLPLVSLFLPEVLLLTSLLGGNGVAVTPSAESMGAAEPLENEGESGPTMLDLGLLLCDMGRADNRFIQELLDDTESLVSSEGGASCGDDASPYRAMENLLPKILLDVSDEGFEVRSVVGPPPEDGWLVAPGVLVPGVNAVAGRGREGFDGLVEPVLMSPAFLFFELGRAWVECSGFPKARPAAATPTVLVATSCGTVSRRVLLS